MKSKLLLLATAVVLLPAWGRGPHVHGNDIGGIIPWTPESAYVYRDLAAVHCAKYNKVARITSVHRRYGDYIAFVCRFPRYYDPTQPVVRSLG